MTVRDEAAAEKEGVPIWLGCAALRCAVLSSRRGRVRTYVTQPGRGKCKQAERKGRRGSKKEKTNDKFAR